MQEISGKTFALSPKDLCTVEQLGRLADAGAASLKIEGRMKTPEYVAVVTGVYRKYLDLYAKHGQYKVEPSDLRDLAQIFSRGGFTEGYLFGNPKKNLMSGDLSKHQGIYIGKVVKGSGAPEKAARGTNPGQTGTRQRGLVMIELAEKLSVGDGIEIRNQDLPGNLVTFMKKKDKKTDSAIKGELVTVGYIDGTISPGDKAYKITDKELMRRAKASYEGKSSSAEKAMRKTDVIFAFSVGLGRPVVLRAADGEGRTVTKVIENGAEKALTKATAPETERAKAHESQLEPLRGEQKSGDSGRQRCSGPEKRRRGPEKRRPKPK